MQVLYYMHFFQTKFCNFSHIARLSPINRRKVINSQKSQFLAHPEYTLNKDYQNTRTVFEK